MAQVKEFYLPDDLYYDRKEHMWARTEDGVVRVGLDAFGACSAGTVAYIKLMPPGREVRKGRAFGSMEGGKYVGPFKAPVAGKVLEVNQAVLDRPGLLNEDHYDRSWLVILEPSNLEPDLADLAHGDDVQPWLASQVEEYESKGLLKPEAERQCQ
ncbi:MAG: glycine cleavage system protein H [Dehalococcoidia bacterium]